MGGLEGEESVALPQGSVCKPLSTPQSCFHKEIYKTGLQCALPSCIMSGSVSGCVNVSVARISIVNSFYFKYHTCKKMMLNHSRSVRQPKSRRVRNLFHPVAGCTCTCIYECTHACVSVCTHVWMYFTDSHIQGMLLAFGIIYKARLLCGALSPCLLPLQPMTLPGFPSASSVLLAACLVQENGFVVRSKHVAVTSFQKYSSHMLAKDLIWSDLVLCKKKKVSLVW